MAIETWPICSCDHTLVPSQAVPFILPLQLRGYCRSRKPRLWDYNMPRLAEFLLSQGQSCWPMFAKFGGCCEESCQRCGMKQREFNCLECQTLTAIKCRRNEMLNNKDQNSSERDGCLSVIQCSADCCRLAGKAWSTCTEGERDLTAQVRQTLWRNKARNFWWGYSQRTSHKKS